MKLKLKLINFHATYHGIIIIALIIFGACKPVPAKLSKDEMKAIVEKQNAKLESCFLTQNADDLAEIYADSAKLSPNGSRFINGRDSIKAFWFDDFKTSKVLKMKTIIMTIDGDQNVIYETGKAYSDILYNDSVYHTHVKYINVWARQSNGEYKLDIDFWNKDGL
jgi:ketosteroid isomerase-like protein